MDATQIISDFILESDEENEEGNKHEETGNPLAKLCILKNEHIPEKEFPLFLGDNMLGRDSSTCTLSLVAPSVSKQHATISLSVYKRKGCESEVEALLWDLGSLNGTRKGHFKLTPNVRYALSEGDALVVADIPCKYIRCTADTPYTPNGTRTPVNQNLNLKAKLSDASRKNEGNSYTGKTKNIAGCSKTKDLLPDSEVTQGTPARTTCLSFEQTPTQPQGTLVPDSGSDSDEERASVGERRRKNIVSDSDAYKSSPTCSTFLSPTNKIVPESEDESPITPSSSNKIRPHRLVSFNNEESDMNIVRQELKEGMALEIVGDSEEEAGNDNTRATLENVYNKRGQSELAVRECKPSFAGEVKLPLSTPVVSADMISQFNMDSDTDLEEDEEMPASSAPVTLNNAQASNSAHFHMDSDTEIDDNDTDRGPDPALSSDDATKHSHTIPIIQPKGISMDSDTDVDDEDLESATAKPTVSQIPKTVEGGASTSQQEFHLDSDTDVDEEETDITGSKPQDSPSQLKTAVAESTSAPPQSLDSDTDDEGILVTSEPTATAAQSDTDVNENSVSPAVEQDNPAEVTLDSDTDVEDSDEDIQEAGDNQTPILHREITPGIQGPLLLNCSTPVHLPEGKTEEMETQAFVSPSSSIRCAVAPVTFSSCLDTQEDDAFVVAETQSFILQPGDPNHSSGLASSVNEKDVACATGGTFQLELSDSSHLQSQAQVLAMESTQAFVSEHGGVSLEETQPYADAITTHEKELPVDIALEATQAFTSEPYSDEEDETPEDTPTEPAITSAPVLTTGVPEVEHLMRKNDTLFETKEEAGQASLCKQGEVLSVAETQPMSTDGESDSEDSAPVFRKRKAKQIQEEETQPLTNTELTVAETQPMTSIEDMESDEDSPPVFKKRKAKPLQSKEEQTQPIDIPKDEESEQDSIQTKSQPFVDSDVTVAETQPISKAENEESDREDSVPVAINRQAEQQQLEDQETQPLVNSELSVAPTQPLVLSEDVGSDAEDSFIPRKKRKAKPLKDTQSLTNSEADSQDSKSTISKEGEGTSEAGTSRVSVRSKAAGARARLGKKEQTVAEQVSAKPLKRQAKGKNKAVPASRRVKPRVDHEDESEEETQRTNEDLIETERVKQQEREEKERLEKERREKEEKEMAAMIQEEEEKQKEIIEKENREKEEKERIEREQKKKEEKERLETAKRAEEEVKRLEEERKNLKLEIEKKERLEKEKHEESNKKEEDQAPRRGRRTARRTIAAPESSVAANDDFPSRRTRSRSNSSNSVSSERSVSSITSLNRGGRGRGRGAKTMDVPVQKTAPRASNRRRTVAAETPVQKEVAAPSPGKLSRSNSSNSLNSVVLSSSVSSQSRGRGGRQRGRGRRTDAEPESVCSANAQSDQLSMQQAPQRGRRNKKIPSEENEDKTDSQESGSTRGQGGAKKYISKHGEDRSNHEEASTSDNQFQKAEIRSKERPDTSIVTVDNMRRGGRKREMETETKKDSKTKFQKTEEAEEETVVNPTLKRNARATSTRRSVKGDVKKDSSQVEQPIVRDRPSVVQKKKRGEQENSGNNSMNQGANPEEQKPQTPTSSAPRKRHSPNLDCSPVAKTPRSDTASPSTFGRLRASSQAYKVLFTGLVDEAGEKVLSHLGGSIAKDVADMTCLVTDKVRRTVKFLCAVAKGVPIVTTHWLEKSGKAGNFLSPSAYIVKDPEQEHKFNFSLKDSLRIASSQPLLQGYEIHVTKSVKPDPVQMKDIISCSGATFLPRMPSSNKPQTLVISCEEDWSLCGPAISSALPVLTAEFILTGILQQKLDIETHKLSGPAASVQPTGGRRKSQKKT